MCLCGGGRMNVYGFLFNSYFFVLIFFIFIQYIFVILFPICSQSLPPSDNAPNFMFFLSTGNKKPKTSKQKRKQNKNQKDKTTK